MPTTFDMRDTLGDMPDAARDYIMQLLRFGSDDEPDEDGAEQTQDEWPDPADYGLSEAECHAYVDEALPRIVQTVGGPGYHVTPPPAGASYHQVVEHYTTQVQQIAGDYYEVTGDGNIVGDGNVGVTGDGSSLAYGEGAESQALYGDGNVQVDADGDIGALSNTGDAIGTTGDGSPAGDVTIGDVDGNVDFGGDQTNLEIDDSFNQDNDLVDNDDSFNQDNDLVDNDDSFNTEDSYNTADSFNQDNDLVDDKDVVDDKDLIDDKDAVDIL